MQIRARRRPLRASTATDVPPAVLRRERLGLTAAVRRSWRGTALVVVLVTTLVVRFTTAEVSTRSTSAPGSASISLQDQLVALEQKAITQPDNLKLYQDLANGYLQWLVQSNDPAYTDLVRRSLDHADQIASGDATNLLIRGAFHLNLHQFTAALTSGRQAAAAAPGNATAYGVIVDAEIEMGRYDDAADDLQRMLDRRPDLSALSRVSYMRELHGDVEGALEAWRLAAVAGTGGSANAFDLATVNALRGDLLFNLGRLDEADAAFDLALKSSSDHLVASVGKARVYAARSNFDASLVLLQALEQRRPSAAGATLLGDIATAARQPAVAADAYHLVRTINRLAESTGSDVDMETALFEADHGGDPNNTLALATKAFSVRPGIHGADALAWARYRSGDIAGAINAIELALRLGTHDAGLHYHAAAIYDAAGQPTRAATELADAFATNPAFTFINRPDIALLAQRLNVSIPTSWKA